MFLTKAINKVVKSEPYFANKMRSELDAILRLRVVRLFVTRLCFVLNSVENRSPKT